MTKEKVNQILLNYKDKIPDDGILVLRGALEQAPEETYDRFVVLSVKNPLVILVVSVFVGAFGVDRFILGDIGLGICKLLFGWLTLGIWPLIDIYFSYVKCKKKNLETLMQAI